MKSSLVARHREFLADRIAHLGHPNVLETLTAGLRNQALEARRRAEAKPEDEKLKAKADALEGALDAKLEAERQDWNRFLNRLHDDWVKAGQPADGRAFLAGYLVAHGSKSPFEEVGV